MEDENSVKVAHRLGKLIAAKPRIMIAKISHKLREEIMKNTYKLKDVENEQGNPYSVRVQLPEPLLTEKMERESRMRSIKKANALISEEEKHRRIDVFIKNKTLYVNKVPQKQHIFPPTVQDLFNTPPNTHEKLDKISFEHTEEITDKGSVFRAHTLKVQNSTDVRLAYKKLKLLFPESNHIMLAYAVKTYVGSHDDGEHGSGKKILSILTNSGRNNTAISVTREYGGAHLGQRRFLHIEKAAKDALTKLYPY